MDATKKLKQCEVPDQVVHWRWISSTKLAAVGKVGVFHIDISNESSPA